MNMNSQTEHNQNTNNSLALLIPIMLALLIFIMAARTPLDSDMWWHLRAGTDMLESGKPLLIDQFSYTRDGVTWINHSWLSEVVLALLYRWMGYTGLTFFVAVLASSSLIITYFFMDGHPLFRSFLILMGAAVSAVVWSPRPQIISLVLLAVVGYIHFLYKSRKQNKLWLLPFVFLIWGNFHGGFAIGFLFLGAVIAGEVLNQVFGSSEFERSLNWKEIRKLGLWSIISWCVLPINPNGFAIWKIPFQTVGVTFLQNHIQEWASPNFHEITQQPMLWVLLLVIFVLGVHKKRIDCTDLMLIVTFTYLALLGRRHMAPFAMINLPIIARYGWPSLSEWFEKKLKPKLPLTKNEKLINSSKSNMVQRFVNLTIVFVLAIIAVGKLLAVSQTITVNGYEKQLFPYEAVEWIKDNEPASNIFSEYEWGGYLSWHLPESKVFVDGRTDLFGDEIINLWLSIISGDEGWAQKLDRYGTDLILINNDRTWNLDLISSGWKEVFRNAKTIIYRR